MLLASSACFHWSPLSRPRRIDPACSIIFAGNVGEEGEGDLRGTRYLYEQSLWSGHIATHLVLDGAGDEIAVTEALGSLRFLVTLQGPGRPFME